MSPCEQYQELISRLADGDLSPNEEKELKAHIETCPDCAMLYQAFSAISRAMEEDMEDVPIDLRENVMAEIRREEIRKRNRLPNALRVVMSAAACVAVIVGVYLGVSMTRGNHLNTAAFETKDAKQEVAFAITADSAAAEAELPRTTVGEAPAEEPALQRDMAVPAPTATPELPAPETRFSADKAAPAAAPSLTEGGAEEAAPALENAAAGAAAEEPAQEREEEAAAEDAVQEPVPEPDAEECRLRGWDLSLLRSLLGGRPAEIDEEALAGCLRYRLLLTTEKESLEIPVYELDGALYYMDPAEGALYQADLTPEELDLFLHS